MQQKSKVYRALLALLGTLSLAGCEDANRNEASWKAIDPALRKAGVAGLAMMLEMVNEGNFKTFGFTSMPKPAEVTVEVPIQVHYLQLDELAQGSYDLSPRALAHGGGEWWFPVDVNGRPVTSMGFHKTSAGWELTSMGNAAHMVAIEELKRARAADANRGHHEYFLLIIPAMFHSYIAHYEKGNVLHLTGVIDHDEHDIEAGVTHTGADLLAKLNLIAQTHESALTAGGGR